MIFENKIPDIESGESIDIKKLSGYLTELEGRISECMNSIGLENMDSEASDKLSGAISESSLLYMLDPKSSPNIAYLYSRLSKIDKRLSAVENSGKIGGKTIKNQYLTGTVTSSSGAYDTTIPKESNIIDMSGVLYNGEYAEDFRDETSGVYLDKGNTYYTLSVNWKSGNNGSVYRIIVRYTEN